MLQNCFQNRERTFVNSYQYGISLTIQVCFSCNLRFTPTNKILTRGTKSNGKVTYFHEFLLSGIFCLSWYLKSIYMDGDRCCWQHTWFTHVFSIHSFIPQNKQKKCIIRKVLTHWQNKNFSHDPWRWCIFNETLDVETFWWCCADREETLLQLSLEPYPYGIRRWIWWTQRSIYSFP